jgi:hypothetical protein
MAVAVAQQAIIRFASTRHFPVFLLVIGFALNVSDFFTWLVVLD